MLFIQFVFYSIYKTLPLKSIFFHETFVSILLSNRACVCVCVCGGGGGG